MSVLDVTGDASTCLGGTIALFPVLSSQGASNTSVGEGFFLGTHPEGCLRIRDTQPAARNGSRSTRSAEKKPKLLNEDCVSPVAKLRADSASPFDGFTIVERIATLRLRGCDCVSPVAKLRAAMSRRLLASKLRTAQQRLDGEARGAILLWHHTDFTDT